MAHFVLLLGALLLISCQGCSKSVVDVTGGVTQPDSVADRELGAPMSMAAAFEAAFGTKISEQLWAEFEAWLDSGAVAGKMPVSPLLNEHSVEIARDFSQVFPGSSVAFVRAKSGDWKLFLGGGNDSHETLEYFLLLEKNNGPRWVSRDTARDLWDGIAVVLHGNDTSLPRPLWTHQAVIDLGEVEDESGKVETVILNRTRSTVEIVNAKFDCSCGSITFHDETIPPYGIVRARIHVNATGKREGPLNLALVIGSNPAGTSPLLVQVKATVVKETHLTPSVVDVGNVLPASSPVIVNTVLHVKHPPAADVFPVYLPDGVRWKRIIREKDKTIRIQMEVDPSRVPPGNFRLAAAIAVRDANNSRESLQSLAISGRRLAAIQMAPAEVFVGKCRPGEKLQRSVRVFRNTTAPLRSVSSNLAGVKPKIEGDSIALEIETPGRVGAFEAIVFVRAGDTYALLPLRGIVETEVADANENGTAAIEPNDNE